MAENNKVKVVGYAKKVFLNDGIEYRNFTPDLVGSQLTSNENTPLFTMGNFAITTNLDPKQDKEFITNNFSNFISLTDLNLTLDSSKKLLDNNSGVVLNLDKTNLKNYALFGSLSEFVRISLENIITKWPASLYLFPIAQSPNGQSVNGYTYENYMYDELTEEATFRVNTTFINNKFDINYLKNGSILDTYNATNDVRNMSLNYSVYSILFNGLEFPVIGFSGSTFKVNDFIYLRVKGDVFSGQPTNSKLNYHIKPNKTIENLFFNELPDFESYLLSRRVTPIYTSIFKFPVKSDLGSILYVSKSITWPISDGYNIDFETNKYIDFVTELLEIATDNDLFSSDLMNRFLVSESISDFDTAPVYLNNIDQDSSGQKMNKTLHVYGRAFDDINNFISGIAFANIVTYDKQNNTPDNYLKNLANVLGWDVTSSVIENDLLANYVTVAPSEFDGETVGLTPIQADIELWRRIILNTPWLWKSKGARKSIEFLLRFIGAPQGLIQFNEYVYKADGPIDLDIFKQVLELNQLDTDLNNYPIDSDGYPMALRNTSDMHFQNKGLWYRETGGSGSTIDVLTGNNPHIGPYDGGYKYINQFKTLIPNFSAVTLTSETITTDLTNLYINNQLGTYNNTNIGTNIDTVYLSSSGNCFNLSSTVINNPYNLDNCGCDSDIENHALSISVRKNPIVIPSTCSVDLVSTNKDEFENIYIFEFYQYNPDGSVYSVNGSPVLKSSNYINQTCCTSIGGTPYLHEIVSSGVTVNSGYYCGDNSITPIFAVNNTGNVITGTTGGQSVANVLANDTLNGGPATLNNVILSQVSTTNNNVTLNTSNGSVNVAAGTQNGVYVVTYKICERRNQTNCSIANVNVQVSSTPIIAIDDTGIQVTGTTGGQSVANVLLNDTLNSLPITIENAVLTQTSTTHPNVTLNTTDGSINIAAGTPTGAYTLVYKVCELGNPSNCASATVNIPVGDALYVDADYIVFSYQFSDGSDLDTRTRIVSPNIGQNTNTSYVGWSKQFSHPQSVTGTTWTSTNTPVDAIIDWAGDNTGVGVESVMIDLLNFKTLYPSATSIVVDCRAFWFGSKGVNPVNISAIFYKGGVMSKGTPTFTYSNQTALNVTTYNADSKIISLARAADPNAGNSGERLTTFTYDFITNIGIFNNNDTITPTV